MSLSKVYAEKIFLTCFLARCGSSMPDINAVVTN